MQLNKINIESLKSSDLKTQEKMKTNLENILNDAITHMVNGTFFLKQNSTNKMQLTLIIDNLGNNSSHIATVRNLRITLKLIKIDNYYEEPVIIKNEIANLGWAIRARSKILVKTIIENLQ